MESSEYVQIDATTCQKRFHCRKRMDLPKQANVTIHCPECHAVVAEFKDAHPVEFLRHENLLNLNYPAKILTPACNFYKKPLR